MDSIILLNFIILLFIFLIQILNFIALIFLGCILKGIIKYKEKDTVNNTLADKNSMGFIKNGK